LKRLVAEIRNVHQMVGQLSTKLSTPAHGSIHLKTVEAFWLDGLQCNGRGGS
jgi:hypothetical protein